MFRVIISVFDPVHIDFRNRRHYQGNFFNTAWSLVYPICFRIGLGEFDDAEIRI